MRSHESAEAETAVDDERLAGDEMRAGGKEEDGLSDVIRVTVSAHGSFGGKSSRLQFGPAIRQSVCEDLGASGFLSPLFIVEGSCNAIQPGATQLTLTSGAKALAIACVSMWRAALDAQ